MNTSIKFVIRGPVGFLQPDGYFNFVIAQAQRFDKYEQAEKLIAPPHGLESSMPEGIFQIEKIYVRENDK